MHIILGYLHNWLEGVLKHQLRVLWGIGRKDKKKKIGKDEQYTSDDLDESESEVEDLEDEEEEWAASRPTPQPTQSRESTPQPTQSRESTPHATSADSDKMRDDPDYVYKQPPAFIVSPGELQTIRNCIRDVSLPTWVARPPTNLGEKRHGKLKADQFLTLFTVIFPLVLPAVLLERNDPDRFQSFYDLVASTNILVSFKTLNSEADQYAKHYGAYRKSILTLHPERRSLPNHHYASHNTELLKHWGPMATLSEFPGERMNGRLQKVSTNNHLGEWFHFLQNIIIY